MTKRVLRQRLWQDDTVNGRNVGENLRDIESAVRSMDVRLRLVELTNYVYQPPIIISQPTLPVTVLNIHTEQLDGTPRYTSIQTDWKWRDNELRLSILNLVAGTRYAAIKLLVIG